MTNLSRGPERPAADRTVAARGTPTGGRRSTRLPPVRVDLGLGPPVVLLEEVGHVEVVAVVERHLARRLLHRLGRGGRSVVLRLLRRGSGLLGRQLLGGLLVVHRGRLCLLR